MPRAKKPTEYQVLTHKGRQIVESKDPSYCGSCSIDIHIAQLNDKSSWVHTFVDKWLELGKAASTPPKTLAGKRAEGTLTDRVLFTEERQAERATDKALIAQFAIGLMRDGSGSFDHDDVALRNRCRDAFKRARVMLEEYKLATEVQNNGS